MLLSVFVITAAAESETTLTVGGVEYKAQAGDKVIYECDFKTDEAVQCGDSCTTYPSNLLSLKNVELVNLGINTIKNTDIAGEIYVNFS